jgi:hypothetical protein
MSTELVTTTAPSLPAALAETLERAQSTLIAQRRRRSYEIADGLMGPVQNPHGRDAA